MTHLFFLETTCLSRRSPDPHMERVADLPASAAVRSEIAAMLAVADATEDTRRNSPRRSLRARLRVWMPAFRLWLRSMPLP